MENITDKKVGPLTFLQLIAIIGGIIGIVALFVKCFDLKLIGNIAISFTGLDLITNKDYNSFDGFQKYLPLLAFIFAILSIVVAIMPMIKPGMIKNASFLMIIFGVLIVIFTAVFGMWVFTDGTLVQMKIMDYAAIGYWLFLVSGILILICGIIDIVMAKKTA